MKALLVLLVCFACLLTGCGGSSTPTPPPTITGAWSGTAVSTVVTGTASITGNLVQGVTNPDGSILFSGTLNLVNSCIATLTISGKLSGAATALTGTFTDGSTLSVTATINAGDTQITGNYAQTAGTSCPSDNGTFSLTKH